MYVCYMYIGFASCLFSAITILNIISNSDINKFIYLFKWTRPALDYKFHL